VNRLTSVTDTGYTRAFSYDAFGNMWISGSPTGITPQGNQPQASGLYNAHNQFGGGAYDAAGNETSVNGNTITYDAESKQASVAGLGVAETYLYDGAGKRVAKGVTGSAPNTVFAYDAQGQLAAEYSTAGNNSPCGTCYLSADHLGTTRLVTNGDAQATVISRHDYLPFGEEIAGSQAGRDSHWGQFNDTVNQKFTGKERDQESGLDYFGARYYGSALGRWASPDWSDAPQAVPYVDFAEPQTLNLYAYGRNNPLKNTDPDGHCDVDVGNGKTEHTPGWCIWHTIGLFETKTETQTRLLNEANGFLTANNIGLIYVNSKWSKPSDASQTQLVTWWQQYNKDNQNDILQGGRGVAFEAAAGLTTPQARDLAKYLGFREVKVDWAPKGGQAVFEKDGRYISRDIDGHQPQGV
jgi:RHS repeat-associated protein